MHWWCPRSCLILASELEALASHLPRGSREPSFSPPFWGPVRCLSGSMADTTTKVGPAGHQACSSSSSSRFGLLACRSTAELALRHGRFAGAASCLPRIAWPARGCSVVLSLAPLAKSSSSCYNKTAAVLVTEWLQGPGPYVRKHACVGRFRGWMDELRAAGWLVGWCRMYEQYMHAWASQGHVGRLPVGVQARAAAIRFWTFMRVLHAWPRSW